MVRRLVDKPSLTSRAQLQPLPPVALKKPPEAPGRETLRLRRSCVGAQPLKAPSSTDPLRQLAKHESHRKRLRPSVEFTDRPRIEQRSRRWRVSGFCPPAHCSSEQLSRLKPYDTDSRAKSIRSVQTVCDLV